jgi:hypothetical protein
MGRSIGVLGTVHQPLDLEFQYFGQTIRVHPNASDTVELDFLEAGRDIDLSMFDKPIEELEAQEQLAVVGQLAKALHATDALMRDSLKKLIHPDDFDTYWKLAVENGQRVRDLSADIKRLTAAVVEADTGFPTMPPSGSPDGPAPTPPTSGDGSSSAAAPASTSEPALPPDLVKSLALERGRSDIQTFYVMEYLTQQQAEQAAVERERRDREKLAAAGIG